ncbi:FtsX-like permease family-domain-containing protein [Paraphysoderma sedebokerense]|nr:FtsX-like permease family-domain-containing protein [Paraphysoderma sedebokerense]
MQPHSPPSASDSRTSSISQQQQQQQPSTIPHSTSSPSSSNPFKHSKNPSDSSIQQTQTAPQTSNSSPYSLPENATITLPNLQKTNPPPNLYPTSREGHRYTHTRQSQSFSAYRPTQKQYQFVSPHRQSFVGEPTNTNPFIGMSQESRRANDVGNFAATNMHSNSLRGIKKSTSSAPNFEFPPSTHFPSSSQNENQNPLTNALIKLTDTVPNAISQPQSETSTSTSTSLPLQTSSLSGTALQNQMDPVFGPHNVASSPALRSDPHLRQGSITKNEFNPTFTSSPLQSRNHSPSHSISQSVSSQMQHQRNMSVASQTNAGRNLSQSQSHHQRNTSATPSHHQQHQRNTSSTYSESRHHRNQSVPGQAPNQSSSLSPSQATVASKPSQVHPVSSSEYDALQRPALSISTAPQLYTIQGKKSLGSRIRENWGTFKILVNYLKADNKRNYRSFAIGLVTVFLVVTFLTLVRNALVRSSIVFVKLSEDLVGQIDLLMTPPLSTGQSSFINYTYVNRSLTGTAGVAGSSPRWLVPAQVSKKEDGQNQSSVQSFNSAAFLLVADSYQEKDAGIGTAWPFRPLGENEVHVTSSLLRALKCRPNSGDKIIVTFSVEDFNRNFAGQNAGSTTNSTVNGTSAALENGGNPLNVTIPKAQAEIMIIAAGLNRSLVLQNATDDGQGNYVFNVTALAEQNTENSLLSFQQEFTVIDAIDKTYGKYPSNLGNVIVMELKPTQLLVTRTLKQYTHNPFFPAVARQLGLPTDPRELENFTMNDYAMSVVIQKTDRISTYTKADDARKSDMIKFSNQVVSKIGIDYPADYIDVLSQALNISLFIRIFMDEIFFTVIAVLALLAILLIYSLLIADVEEKTFEYGMLRSLGLKQGNLVTLLILQSLYFSIPAILLGLLFCFILYIPIEYVLSSFANIPMSLKLDPSAWTLGVIIGLVLPIVGMVIPIRRALTKTLRDALDVYHNVVFDTIVHIQRLEDIGLSLNETLLSVLLVAIGFLVYYMVPLSFIFNNLGLFFRILTIILLGMVLGQTLLGQVLQHGLELIALRLCVWGTDRKLRDVVAKNLSSHLKRNRKTALMFTLCLAYIIFAATMFRLQSDSLSQNIEWTYGADISVEGRGFQYPLPEDKLVNFLERVKMKENQTSFDHIVQDYTFTTYALNSYYPVTNMYLSGLASISRPSVRLFGVQQNFLDVTLNKYYMPSEIDYSLGINHTTNLGQPDVVKRLNESIDPRTGLSNFQVPQPIIVPSDPSRNLTSFYNSSIPILVSESLRSNAYIDVFSKCLLQIDYRPTNSVWTSNKIFLTRPVAFLQKLPSFPTIMRLQSSNTPVIVSENQYQYLLNQVDTLAKTNVTTFTGVNVPKGWLLIKLKQGVGTLQVEALINELNTVITDSNVKVKNLKEQLTSTESAAQFITLLFNIVAVVGIILSFFVLWLSFTANIRENSWEFGVLRAIGLNAGAVVRIYIYEALCIILATIVIGTAIGIITAITLSLQFNLFTEMPFSFSFPTYLFIFVVGMSLLVSVLGSYFPAREFRKKQIAIALKGQ